MDLRTVYKKTIKDSRHLKEGTYECSFNSLKREEAKEREERKKEAENRNKEARQRKEERRLKKAKPRPSKRKGQREHRCAKGRLKAVIKNHLPKEDIYLTPDKRIRFKTETGSHNLLEALMSYKGEDLSGCTLEGLDRNRIKQVFGEFAPKYLMKLFFASEGARHHHLRGVLARLLEIPGYE